jgi:hypothetical protein
MNQECAVTSLHGEKKQTGGRRLKKFHHFAYNFSVDVTSLATYMAVCYKTNSPFGADFLTAVFTGHLTDASTEFFFSCTL